MIAIEAPVTRFYRDINPVISVYLLVYLEQYVHIPATSSILPKRMLEKTM
jgi:hypothetical protein